MLLAQAALKQLMKQAKMSFVAIKLAFGAGIARCKFNTHLQAWQRTGRTTMCCMLSLIKVEKYIKLSITPVTNPTIFSGQRQWWNIELEHFIIKWLKMTILLQMSLSYLYTKHHTNLCDCTSAKKGVLSLTIEENIWTNYWAHWLNAFSKYCPLPLKTIYYISNLLDENC